MSTGGDQVDELARFVAELRRMRRENGSPSYREMSRRAHYSPSTLAEALQGRRLPSRQVVEAIAKACGADPGTWGTRWDQAASAIATTEELLPPVVPDAASRPDSTAEAPRDPERGRRLRLSTVSIGVTAAVIISAVGGWTARALRDSPPPAAASGVPHDGADPSDAGCGSDSQVVAQSPLTLNGHDTGVLELRYSPRCHGGWARFRLAPRAVPVLVEVRLEAQDGRVADYAQKALPQLPVYTDLLRPDGGCLRAIASTTTSPGVVTALTDCLTLPP